MATTATIARSGGKRRTSRLLLFSGEAYNVEMGITNELFQDRAGRESRPASSRRFPTMSPISDATTPVEVLGGIERFANFMPLSRLRRSPLRQPRRRDLDRQRQAEVHRRRLRAVPHAFVHDEQIHRLGAEQQAGEFFSDLLIHDMAMAWPMESARVKRVRGNSAARRCGASGRGFSFCTTDAPRNWSARFREHSSNGSEANGVINNFNNLSEGRKQDVLNFLRSL